MLPRTVATTRLISWFFILIIGLQSLGCTFYKARSKEVTATPVMDMSRYTPQRFNFVLHLGDEQVQLNNVNLQAQTNEILGSIGPLDLNLQRMANNVPMGRTRRYTSSERFYIRQVHIYATEYTDIGDDRVSIDGTKIERVDVYSQDGIATFASYTLTGFVTLVAALTIWIWIVCSCPHVYTFDGEQYEFSAALLTGAVAPALERHDHRILPDYDRNRDSYKLKIVNEEHEIQRIDLLELIGVYHAPGEMIVPQRGGRIIAATNPVTPMSATLGDLDMLYEVSQEDDLACQFDQMTEDDLSQLDLQFAVPADAANGNLILSAKNSNWGGYVYYDFLSRLGNKYDEWAEKNRTKPPEKAIDWTREQGMVMKVETKVADQWQLVDYVDLMGDVALNKTAIPIQIASNQDILEVRLTSGFKFWDLDLVAMDFEDKGATDIRKYAAGKAVDAEGNLVAALLAEEDADYMELPRKDEWVEVEFDLAVPEAGQSRTVLVHGKGYYMTQYTFEGRAQWFKAMKFRDEAALSRHSAVLYAEFQKSVEVTNYIDEE